jgi:hypothetical protein
VLVFVISRSDMLVSLNGSLILILKQSQCQDQELKEHQQKLIQHSIDTQDMYLNI